MKGDGLEYISQVSIDGEKSFNPQDSLNPIERFTAEGQKVLVIPYYTNKKLLQIKLRDFTKTEGLPILDYKFINLGKGKTIQK